MKTTLTPLQKALTKYEHLLQDWKKNSFCDDLIEEHSYTHRDNELKIIFQEDLREHIVNFSIIHPSKRIIKVFYRQCVLGNGVIAENIISSLKKITGQNNIESKEIAIYFDFLKANKIIDSNPYKL